MLNLFEKKLARFYFVDMKTEVAIFAGGCFWGVEHLLKEVTGVLSTQVGYTGGTTKDPTYAQVCSHTTGHAEAVLVEFDPALVSFEKLAKVFFEIHDPTQYHRQGPDRGDQYRSAIFYLDQTQKEVALTLLEELRNKNILAVTEIVPASSFYPAEELHQRYYEKTGHTPYCHVHTKRF